jgi:hypothetical protein
VAEAAVSVVVDVLMVMEAEAATVKLSELVPVVCADKSEAERAAKRGAATSRCLREKECFIMQGLFAASFGEALIS